MDAPGVKPFDFSSIWKWVMGAKEIMTIQSRELGVLSGGVTGQTSGVSVKTTVGAVKLHQKSCGV